jgi:photosystem II stability/assembly factor-like uncharacterized protein
MMKKSIGRAMALAAVPLLALAFGAGGASAQPASGNPPPPKGFEVESASFVSAQTGFVLGARGCSRMPCAAKLEKTVNGGKTWTKLPSPAISVNQPFDGTHPSTVSTVRFANANDGWLFNPALWATTDGGKHWHRVNLPGGGLVVNVASAGGEVYAEAAPLLTGIYQARLFEAPAGGGTWTLVKNVDFPTNELTAFGHSAWAGSPLGAGGQSGFWTTTDNGKHWTALKFRCPVEDPDAFPVAAASPTSIALVCTDPSPTALGPGSSYKFVYTSINGGKTFHLVGQAPDGGQPIDLAMPPGHPKLMTMSATSGASWLYRSVDGGTNWQQKGREYYDGGLGFRDLQYASATNGYVVHFGGIPFIAYSDGLMATTNAGASWHTVSIP